MALSPNYGWAEPDNSSLVKNGAADIRTLGDSIDTSVWNIGFGQAGKNKIINGDFNIWQRGTSFTPNSGDVFTADRWIATGNGSGATRTVTQQAFTAGAAPVAGYEGSFFLRWNQTVAGTSATYTQIKQKIEDVRTFAGQTVTFSFWGKAAANTTITSGYEQYFGTGGSSLVAGTISSGFNLTTSWQRFSATVSIPSISGKTVGGSDNQLTINFGLPNNATFTVDIWGVQLEYGSKATPFDTASGTLQGELSLCQRYYWRVSPGNSGVISTFGTAKSTTAAVFSVMCPTTMRKGPDILDYSNIVIYDGVTGQTVSALTLGATFASTGTIISFDATSTSLTQYRPYFLYTNNANGFFGVSAEL
jgi:hypothetical protein